MLESLKNNKKVVLLCSGVVLIVILAILIATLQTRDNFSDANFAPESISKIHIKMGKATDIYSTNEFVIEKRENIELVLKYVDKMSKTELKVEHNFISPVKYELTYYMINGKVKKYVHEFLAVTSDDGFENIFKLKEVIPQINYEFTTKKEDIRDIILFVWTDEKADKPLRFNITDDEQIDFIIKVGQENMLQDIEQSQKRELCGVQFIDYTGRTLFIIYISPDMYMYDELCEKVPKVKEFAEMIGTQK